MCPVSAAAGGFDRLLSVEPNLPAKVNLLNNINASGVGLSFLSGSSKVQVPDPGKKKTKLPQIDRQSPTLTPAFDRKMPHVVSSFLFYAGGIIWLHDLPQHVKLCEETRCPI